MVVRGDGTRRRPVKTAGGQGTKYTSGGEKSAPGLSAAQRKWVRENVLGVRDRKPGRPEIVEAGVSGARKAALKALLAGEPRLIETTTRSVAKQAEDLYESEKRWRSILKKLDPADRAKAEQLLRRFGPESGYYKPMDRTEVLRQVEEASARRSGKKPKSSTQGSYRKPAVEWKSKAAEDLAAKRAASAKRGEASRQMQRDQWREMFDQNLASIVLGPEKRKFSGVDVIGRLERASRVREATKDPRALLKRATPEQQRRARDLTNEQWTKLKSYQASDAMRRARTDITIGVTKNGKRSEETIKGISRRESSAEIPIQREPTVASIDPSRTDVGGDVTWKMVEQRFREAQAAARRAARKQRIAQVKAKKIPKE